MARRRKCWYHGHRCRGQEPVDRWRVERKVCVERCELATLATLWSPPGSHCCRPSSLDSPSSGLLSGVCCLAKAAKSCKFLTKDLRVSLHIHLKIPWNTFCEINNKLYIPNFISRGGITGVCPQEGAVWPPGCLQWRFTGRLLPWQGQGPCTTITPHSQLPCFCCPTHGSWYHCKKEVRRIYIKAMYFKPIELTPQGYWVQGWLGDYWQSLWSHGYFIPFVRPAPSWYSLMYPLRYI